MLLENATPEISQELLPVLDYALLHNAFDNDVVDELDALEIFDIIRNIKDPEHPLTLEQLNVVSLTDIELIEKSTYTLIKVLFTPTIPHCSMATLIGLCIVVKLIYSLSPRLKISVAIKHGTHHSEDAINKQLNDKERVAAAMENDQLLKIVHQCIAMAPPPSDTTGCCCN